MSDKQATGSSIEQPSTAVLDFFYPLSFLVPQFDVDAIEYPPYRIAKRKWQTTTFDLATLAIKHKLHLPYQIMDVFLSRCNVELCISGCSSLENANEALQDLRIALYASSVSPFLCPFVTTYSINEYSGINSRDSEALRKDLLPALQEGLMSANGTLEAWSLEPSFLCTVLFAGTGLREETFRAAAAKAQLWRKLRTHSPALRAVTGATIEAPKLVYGQSLLHVWTAIEAFFPSVSTEVSFRIALYIAQLIGGEDRMATHDRVRRAYSVRSKVAHGSKMDVDYQEWEEAWNILMDCINALYRRGELPTEQQLLTELLTGNTAQEN